MTLVVAVNTALFGEDLAALMLVQDTRAACEGVAVANLSHDVADSKLRLKKNTARNGAHEKRTLHRILDDRAPLININLM